MNFSKVKLVICLCLIVVNVVFGIMCVRLISDKNYISEEEALLAQKHLDKNGINVSFDKDDRKIFGLPIYYAETESSSDDIPLIYRKMTETFFDTTVQESSYIKTPEGYSVSVKNKDGLLLGISSLFSDNRFECYIEDAVEQKDIVEISKIPHLQKLGDDNGAYTEIAQGYIDRAFRNYSVKFSCEGSREYKGGNIVCFSGSFSDVTSLNLYINIYIKKGELVCCAGMIPNAEFQKKYGSPLIDSINLMYVVSEYLGEKNADVAQTQIKIDDFGLKYKSYRFDDSVYYLIPTWVVEYTDEKSQKNIIAVDAVTGRNIEKLK